MISPNNISEILSMGSSTEGNGFHALFSTTSPSLSRADLAATQWLGP
jgi:hypothetical protein